VIDASVSSISINDNNNLISTLTQSSLILQNVASGNNFNITLENAVLSLNPTISLNDVANGFTTQLTIGSLVFNDGNTSTLYAGIADIILSGDNNKRVICDAKSQDFYAGDPFGSSNGVSIGIIQSSKEINLDSKGNGITRLGDINAEGNGTRIFVDDANRDISMETDGGTITSFVNNGDINLSSWGTIKIGDINVSGNGQVIEVSNANSNILLTANNGVNISKSTIQYPSTYNTTSQTLGITSNYAQTFNGTTLTGTLPTVSSTNVGIQFLITNTNASNLTVNSSGGQLIYSTGVASSSSRTLNTGNSQIFTAIRTTGATTYGWSMV
jgi:hypothetical protein